MRAWKKRIECSTCSVKLIPTATRMRTPPRCDTSIAPCENAALDEIEYRLIFITDSTKHIYYNTQRNEMRD